MPATCQRELFSIPRDVHYLNCAYMSPLSNRVVAAGCEGVRRKAGPWEIEAPHFFDDCDIVRERFARLIGAEEPQRVAIVPSASYGFAQLARNTRLERGQSVVILDEEFPSNVYIWKRLCAETGGRLDVVRRPELDSGDSEAWNDAILAAIRPETRVISIGPIHWTDGYIFDLTRIGERARQVGAAFLIDGSQTVGAMPFDVNEIQPDAVVCPTYKWLMGPYSGGLVWFGARYDDGTPIEESWITREGSSDFAGLVRYTDRYRPGAVRYDVGETSNFALMPMIRAGLEHVLEWAPEQIQAYDRALTGDLIPRVREAGFLVADDRSRAGHLFGFRLPSRVRPEALRAQLQKNRIWVSVRGTAVRVSLHLFNDAEDVAALARAMEASTVSRP
jgi:selenocysteine lyase/cysteine desulfurase